MTTKPTKPCTLCNRDIGFEELLYLIERDGEDKPVCAKCANAMKDVEWADVSDRSHGGSMRKLIPKR